VTKLSPAPWLEGKRVALAGRLASMSRDEAAQLIAAHGGTYSHRVLRDAMIVVVGRDGWPLAQDGRPSRKLRKALSLAEKGYDVEIVAEEDLLGRLHCPRGPLKRHCTLRELADLLHISPDRLDQWQRAGLIQPVATVDSIRYFDFCQVAGAKRLCHLVRSGITVSRLRHSLRQLQVWLGDVAFPLGQLTLLDAGRTLAVRLDGGQLAEPSGQLLFDFAPTADEGYPASVPWVEESLSLDHWLREAAAAESKENWPRAVQAYRQALLSSGPTAEICFNLAGALYALGHYGRAGERYRQVLELDPDFSEAWNNLGTVLAYEQQNEEAVGAYRRALRVNPRYADARYNLADTLDDLGRVEESLDEWRRYLELEPRGEQADYARERLKLLERRRGRKPR
jgi:tetratricopeptide (TPR) repeat protein